VTGGWQTSKEPAYVEASRPRHGTDWYVNRDELGHEGQDTDRIQRLAEHMKRSTAQTPSLAHRELAVWRDPDLDMDLDFGINQAVTPTQLSPLPGLIRSIYDLTQPDQPEQERAR
jgi:hypothetical protein